MSKRATRHTSNKTQKNIKDTTASSTTATKYRKIITSTEKNNKNISNLIPTDALVELVAVDFK